MAEITGCETLSDDALLRGAKDIAAREREAVERLVRHLAEIRRRRLHEREGYATLYYYCLGELRLSEAEAWRRSVAAQAALRYPMIFGMLQDGSLSLAVLGLVAPLLNAGNYRTLLPRLAGKSKREAERLAADLRGFPAVPDSVRVLAVPDAAPAGAAGGAAPALPLLEGAAPAGASAPASPPGRASPAQDPPAPLGRRVEIRFTAPEDLWMKLARIRELLRFRFPVDRLEALLGVLADAWLDRHDPERRLASQAARGLGAPRPAAGAGIGGDGPAGRDVATRYVPRAVRDEVYRRDGGRCGYVSPSGKRCGVRAPLEFDHKTPFALGGSSDDADNLRLLCRAHNQRAAREAFHAARGPAPGADSI